MVRVANTGVSAMIDARGRITGSIGTGEQGYLDAVLPRPLPATLYWKTGDFPVILILIAGLIALRARKYQLTKG
jgi:apolipoprotein N-acyltransferase